MAGLLDSNIFIEGFRHYRESLASWIEKQQNVMTCDMAVAEFLAGAHSLKDPKNQDDQLKFFHAVIEPLPSVTLSREICERAGFLIGRAKLNGKQIKMPDAMIGACAESKGVPVWTDDEDFKNMGCDSANPLKDFSSQASA